MKIKFSCVIDSASIFKTQALIFVKSLLFNGIKPKDIYIHSTEISNDDFFNWLEELGINLLKVATYDKRNKYCNKLEQLKTFQKIEDYDYVFLMDCDTALISLEGLELKHDFYSKIVDFPNPPIDILKGIYAKAELKFKEAETSLTLANNNKTEFNNCNGGLYIFSNKGLNTIAPKWIKWSNWCIDNADLFTEHYSKHADQVGFALAMSETQSKLNHLDITWNYPIHVNKELLPNIKPNIIHFHQQLTNDNAMKYVGLKKVDAAITEINFILNDNNKYQHKRDISKEQLNTAFNEVKRPDLLQYLVDVSRTNLGFYTRHYPRVFEYSWLLEQLENEKEGVVLDIGAGVCPLPFCLSEQGLKVITVDSHSKKRTSQDRKEWNEWGFLDYGLIDERITSYNQDFLKFKTGDLLDCIYSISVIEHIPRKGRIKLVRKAAKLLKKEGLLLLTIDLIPNTNNLWNLSEDKEVEPITEHGDITSFKKELKRFGFEVIEEQVQRNILDSRTDVYYVKAGLKKRNKFFKFF